MKFRRSIFPLLLAAFLAHAEHPLIYTSPARFADEVAAAAFAAADGDGGTSAIQPVQEQAKPVGADLLWMAQVFESLDFSLCGELENEVVP